MFIDLKTGLAKSPMSQVLFSSAASGWNGFLLQTFLSKPFEVTDICCQKHTLFLQLDKPIQFEWQTDSGTKKTDILPGQFSLFPAYFRYAARSHDSHTVMTLALDNEFIASTAAECGALDGLEFEPQLAKEDTLVKELLLSLKKEVEQGAPNGPSYAEALVNMLVVHLIRHYSRRKQTFQQSSNKGLTKIQLRKVFEFVAAQLASPISLKQMATQVGISTYHFARQFKLSTGLTPHEFLTRQRLERAKELLVGNRPKLAAVAAQSGFYDQSHFARHFKRQFGLTPLAYVRKARTSPVNPLNSRMTAPLPVALSMAS